MTNPSTIVFHYPGPLADSPKSGSEVRPVRMLEALKGLGHEVIAITGHSPERKALISSLTTELEQGRHVDAVYSECVTQATMLSDADHLPRHPLLEPLFFRTLGHHDVRRGLFYRDIYWKFPIYRDNVAPSRRYPALAAYHFDLQWYRRFIDVLFVPSDEMVHVIPGHEGLPQTLALPPGSDPQADGPASSSQADDTLRLVYVGGARAPLYDLTPLLEAVAAVPSARLRVCCPEADGPAIRQSEAFGTGRVELFHVSSTELAPHYAWADAACIVFAPHEYRDFAMPIKLFEAIGAGLPIVASSGTSVASFVEETGFGWIADSAGGIAPLLERLANERVEVDATTTTVREQRDQHTWQARARTAVEALTSG